MTIQAILEAPSFIFRQLSHCESAEGGNNHAKYQQLGQDISHDLLLEQSTPDDIATATQQRQG